MERFKKHFQRSGTSRVYCGKSISHCIMVPTLEQVTCANCLHKIAGISYKLWQEQRHKGVYYRNSNFYKRL
jgi:hypothetical protein